MRSDTIVILKIGRPGFEFVLHNAEAFLDHHLLRFTFMISWA